MVWLEKNNTVEFRGINVNAQGSQTKGNAQNTTKIKHTYSRLTQSS